MIRVLEKNIADKIAAGEVIDRPVSVVKELVENSIDAGATSITVEIRGGGKEYIRITDDGCGIGKEEVKTAFLRHATSKISELADLDAIGTLGFRGEALASICAVSRLEMITRTEDESMGTCITLEGGNVLEERPIGCPVGTTITVKDLFFNVPARLKFMGTDSTEGRRITDVLSRIALSYPDVRFRFINGKKEGFATGGKGKILDNILRIYGRDLERDLLPVDLKMKGCVIRGFISGPGLTSSSRNRQFFCVNGRIVSSKTIERGLEKAYKLRIFAGRYPLAFLFISVPAESIDVNVHPTKKEIRFDDPFEMEDMIEVACRKALDTKGSIPGVDVKARTKAMDSAEELPEPTSYGEGPEKNTEKAPETENDVPLEEVDVKNLLESLRTEVREEQMTISSEDNERDGDERERLDIAYLHIIGIVLDTYIVATDHQSMYLIDQHAAHERVLFERFLSEYKREDTPSQGLLIPLQFTVSADVSSVESIWMDHLIKLGYDIEPFGERVYIVRRMPAFLPSEEGEAFIRQFFIELEEKPDSEGYPALERIIMRSCKSAVKGGDRLHEDEVRSLMVQLSKCDDPYSCPHGRPVFVKMSRYDLERMFNRA